MNYIQEMGEKLKAMLTELDENKQKQIIRFVQDKVLASYRNGIEAGNKPKRKYDGKGSQ